MCESSSDSEQEGHYTGPIKPYQFEPCQTPCAYAEETAATQREETDGRSHTHVSSWCVCGNCCSMATDKECKCCKELKPVVDKCKEASEDLLCITQHPGFYSVVLCPWNLQAVSNGYRQLHGDMPQTSMHERYRYTAYRHFVQWCWGFVGKHVRVVLPACVVNAVRTAFPSDTYQGFKLPAI